MRRSAETVKKTCEDPLDLRQWTDEDDLADWKVEATGEDTRVSHSVVVKIRSEYMRHFLDAAEAEGLDFVQYLQRKVDELGESLRQRDAVPAQGCTP